MEIPVPVKKACSQRPKKVKPLRAIPGGQLRSLYLRTQKEKRLRLLNCDLPMAVRISQRLLGMLMLMIDPAAKDKELLEEFEWPNPVSEHCTEAMRDIDDQVVSLVTQFYEWKMSRTEFGLQCPTSPLLPPRKVLLEDLIYTSCTEPIPQPAAARTPRLHQPSAVTHLFYAFSLLIVMTSLLTSSSLIHLLILLTSSSLSAQAEGELQQEKEIYRRYRDQDGLLMEAPEIFVLADASNAEDLGVTAGSLSFQKTNRLRIAIVLMAPAQESLAPQVDIQTEEKQATEQVAKQRALDQTVEQLARKNLSMVIYSQPSATDATHFYLGAADSPIRSDTFSPPENLITQGTPVSPSSSIQTDLSRMTDAIKEVQSSFGYMRDD
ncbi:hypothetical protein F511_30717 [Dorcoceras hygrometricum]|uniref:Uncharacterized protein n=1 Tax=Dorcoceras hygrometricum TaxID=472368 RepID=A0A2Z7AQX9_9LAMI|nr:hypothetical protein F511_30717 [Dorcoceras hygrometricum]